MLKGALFWGQLFLCVQLFIFWKRRLFMPFLKYSSIVHLQILTNINCNRCGRNAGTQIKISSIIYGSASEAHWSHGDPRQWPRQYSVCWKMVYRCRKLLANTTFHIRHSCCMPIVSTICLGHRLTAAPTWGRKDVAVRSVFCWDCGPTSTSNKWSRLLYSAMWKNSKKSHRWAWARHMDVNRWVHGLSLAPSSPMFASNSLLTYYLFWSFIPQPAYPFSDTQMNFPSRPSSNGMSAQSQSSESLSSAAAAMAAVVGLRQQMHQIASAGYHPDVAASFNLPAHCSNPSSSGGNNGGSASCIPMPKLGSPAASGQLGNNGGSGIPIPRLASPAMPGLSNNMHSLSGLSSLHMMQTMGSHLAGSSGSQSSQQQMQPGITITPAHGSSSSFHGSLGNGGASNAASSSSQAQSFANAMAQLSSSASLASNSSALNINRISSPAGSIHDLRMISPDSVPTHSPLDALESAGMNLAASNIAYKVSRGYSASPRSDLFHEELNDFVSAQRAGRLSGYKESSGGSIKLEPMTDCHGDWSEPLTDVAAAKSVETATNPFAMNSHVRIAQ